MDEAGSRVRISAYNARRDMAVPDSAKVKEYMQVRGGWRGPLRAGPLLGIAAGGPRRGGAPPGPNPHSRISPAQSQGQAPLIPASQPQLTAPPPHTHTPPPGQVLDSKEECVKGALYEEASILRRREMDYRAELVGAAASGSSVPVVDVADIEAIVATWTGEARRPALLRPCPALPHPCPALPHPCPALPCRAPALPCPGWLGGSGGRGCTAFSQLSRPRRHAPPAPPLTHMWTTPAQASPWSA
jgi:hypothetical protein